MTQQTYHTLYKSNLIFKWGRQVVKAQEKGMKRASQTTRMNTKRKKNKYIWIFFSSFIEFKEFTRCEHDCWKEIKLLSSFLTNLPDENVPNDELI